MNRFLFFGIVPLLFFSCSDATVKKSDELYTDGASTLFTKIPPETSNLRFQNNVQDTYAFNFLNYPSMYSGAGVAVGDVDHDGLEDVYLVSNFGPNKLYRNLGDLKFEDITLASKTTDSTGFSTGTTMLDVNADGWLDIYVCKAASLRDHEARRNLLFVNQQDGTFLEAGKQWGLDDPGYTTQAYPIDYDKDGDMDLYVVNYRYDFKNNTKIDTEIQSRIEEVTSDQLYRNDGNRFTKVTGPAGLYNKAWGLAAAIGDFNEDGWPDIYVCNDYLEPDFLYINQKDGTFRNEINERIKHISFYSMGSDYADLNNDLLPDLITLDMAAENYARSKENMASMSTENFMLMVASGYHHAYMANMLHYNMGNGRFRETGQMSGIVKTDWSWAPLIADYDNDGLKDIFVSNGILKDYTNQDFRTTLKQKHASGERLSLEGLLELLPSQKLANYAYKNNGDLTFSKAMESWGLDDPSFSNGAVYSDLDNDGDLDLVISNINEDAWLYRNNANANFVQVQLEGPTSNPLAFGTEVIIETDSGKQYQQLYTARGYESSVTSVLHFGLGETEKINKVTAIWPDGKATVMNRQAANKRLTLAYEGAAMSEMEEVPSTLFNQLTPGTLGLNYQQQENNFNDFGLQLLLPQKQSTLGSALTRADVNGDGLDDFFVGNATGAPAALFLQLSNGTFTRTNQNLFLEDAAYEDGDAIFFDADNDGDQDLYVVSTGYELQDNSGLLQDRLYLNDGSGRFERDTSRLPTMLTAGKGLAVADYDNDGDQDLFVGGYVIPGRYPLSPRSYLLRNDDGTFTDVLKPETALTNAGMVTDATFTDFDADGDLDLLVVGQWMAPTFYENNNGEFEKAETINGLEFTEGWWFSAMAKDLDNDGDDDYVLGNLGTNNKFQPSKEKPLSIHARDFDDNGSFDVALSKISDGKEVPIRGKECSSEQNPFLLERIATYKEFASMEMKDIYGIDELENASKFSVHMLQSAWVENLGNGSFEIHILPNDAQTGPTMDILIEDLNGDGHLDLLGIGAIYDAEVETIRYDSNYGYVLLGDGQGVFTNSTELQPHIATDAKNIIALNISGESHYVVVSNNSPLQVFHFEP